MTDDANQSVGVTVGKTIQCRCSDLIGKKDPPKPSPKPRKQQPTPPSKKPVIMKLKPSLVPNSYPSEANTGLIGKTRNITKREIVKPSVQYLGIGFRNLPNELQSEISTKIFLIHGKSSAESIWKVSFSKVLQEFRNNKQHNMIQIKAAEEKCEKIMQETFALEKQHRVVLERTHELEYSLKLAKHEKLNLQQKLADTEFKLETQKALNRQELQEKIGIIENLNTQRIFSHEQLKQVRAQLTYAEGRLRNKEFEFKSTSKRLRETQEQLKVTEANLSEIIAKLMSTGEDSKDLKSEDVEAKLLSIGQTLEKERRVWLEERKQLMKQAEELESESSDSKAKYLELEHKLEITRAEKDVLKEQMLENNRRLDELRDKYKSAPVLLHTFKTISVKKKNWTIFGFSIRSKSSKKKDELTLAGITILGKELFVAVAEISEVEVYDSITFSFSRRLKLKELNFPLDIASCNINKYLYILNYNEKEKFAILRVDPHGKVIKKWSTGVDCGYCLSVTSESNVILAKNEKHKLNEYSADGDLIREIDLSSDAGTLFPVHAIKLANGDFVVSHASADEDVDDALHRVCVVDADGKLKKSFGGKSGAFIEQVDSASHLSVLGNGFVMVADCGNSRVLLLNSDLEFRREFLSEEKHGLDGPSRILLDESMDRLFVVNCTNSQIRILVFYCK